MTVKKFLHLFVYPFIILALVMIFWASMTYSSQAEIWRANSKYMVFWILITSVFYGALRTFYKKSNELMLFAIGILLIFFGIYFGYLSKSSIYRIYDDVVLQNEDLRVAKINLTLDAFATFYIICSTSIGVSAMYSALTFNKILDGTE